MFKANKNTKTNHSAISKIWSYTIVDSLINPIAVSLNNGRILSIQETQSEEKDIVCLGKELRGKFEVIPNINLPREIIHVSGFSHIGKSSFVRNYISRYQQLFPKRNIYVIGRKYFKSQDRIIRLQVNNSTELLKLEMFDFSNSLIVFDDLDNISRQQTLVTQIHNLINYNLFNGEDKHTSMVMITHNELDNILKAQILSKVTKLVIFPEFPKPEYAELLRAINLPTNEIKRILKEKSRWVVIGAHTPKYIVTKTKIKVLKNIPRLETIFEDEEDNVIISLEELEFSVKQRKQMLDHPTPLTVNIIKGLYPSRKRWHDMSPHIKEKILKELNYLNFYMLNKFLDYLKPTTI